MQAIQIHQHGDADALKSVDISTPSPQHDEILVKNHAIGVNFVDVLHRRGGVYPVDLPLIPGIEGAGTVEAIGDSVTKFQIGDRVAYGGFMGGDYAEFTIIPQDRLVPIPDGLSFELAAAGLLQGMTAYCLTHDVYPVKQGDVALIHAAAGGVGLCLVQYVKKRGGVVIGTMSSPDKAQAVIDIGGDHTILYTQQDFAAETMRLTQEQGVHVVYDAVGLATFDKSINLIRPRGYMVSYGQTSGKVPPFDINRLSGIGGTGGGGSLFLTRASLSFYTQARSDLLAYADQVLNDMLNGVLKIKIMQRFPLAQAADAHRLLESRQTIGKILLLPTIT